MEGYFVYVLYSEEHRRYYFGSSSNPQNRLLSHNDPRNRGWTKRYAPWKMVYSEELATKHDALMKEKWLKSGIGREFIHSLGRND